MTSKRSRPTASEQAIVGLAYKELPTSLLFLAFSWLTQADMGAFAHASRAARQRIVAWLQQLRILRLEAADWRQSDWGYALGLMREHCGGLRQIRVTGDRLPESAGALLKTTAHLVGKSTGTLEKLACFRGFCSTPIMAGLARCPQLREVELENISPNASAEAEELLGEVVVNCPSLQRLYLWPQDDYPEFGEDATERLLDRALQTQSATPLRSLSCLAGTPRVFDLLAHSRLLGLENLLLDVSATSSDLLVARLDQLGTAVSRMPKLALLSISIQQPDLLPADSGRFAVCWELSALDALRVLPPEDAGLALGGALPVMRAPKLLSLDTSLAPAHLVNLVAALGVTRLVLLFNGLPGGAPFDAVAADSPPEVALLRLIRSGTFAALTDWEVAFALRPLVYLALAAHCPGLTHLCAVLHPGPAAMLSRRLPRSLLASLPRLIKLSIFVDWSEVRLMPPGDGADVDGGTEVAGLAEHKALAQLRLELGDEQTLRGVRFPALEKLVLATPGVTVTDLDALLAAMPRLCTLKLKSLAAVGLRQSASAAAAAIPAPPLSSPLPLALSLYDMEDEAAPIIEALAPRLRALQTDESDAIRVLRHVASMHLPLLALFDCERTAQVDRFDPYALEALLDRKLFPRLVRLHLPSTNDETVVEALARKLAVRAPFELRTGNRTWT